MQKTNISVTINLIVLFLSFVALLPLQLHASSTSSITANVSVLCPFGVYSQALFHFNLSSNIIIPYSLKTLYYCTIPMMNGTFTFYNAIFSYSMPLTANLVSREIQNSSVILPQNVSNKLSNSTYYAKISFTSYKESNSSTSEVILLKPVNITLTSLSSTSPVSQNLQEVLATSFNNNGQYASGNLTLNLLILGPVNYTFKYVEHPLSPGSHENVSLTFTNITTVPGTYSVYANVSYMSNGHLRYSNTKAVEYTVLSVSPQPPTPSKPKVYIKQVPMLNISSAPIYTSLATGQSVSAYLGLANIGSYSEYVNLTLNSTFSSLVSLSTNTLLLAPHSSSSVGLLLSGTKPGLYTIPIELNISVVNGTRRVQQEFLTVIVQNTTAVSKEPIVSTQIILVNNTNLATATLKVTNPYNYTLSNFTLATYLPIGIADNISRIGAYGLPNNITIENGQYVIRWLVPHLSVGQSTYAYYTVYKPISQQLLQLMQSTVTLPSVPKSPAILKVLEVSLPSTYPNSTAELSTDLLYTGTYPAYISATVTGPPSVTIYNASQTFIANPNQFTSLLFYMTAPSKPGAYVINLFISSQQANYSTTVPLIVMQPIVTTTTTTVPTTTIPPKPAISISATKAAEYGITAIFILIIIAIVIRISRRRGMPKYNAERAAHLKLIREEVKREGGSIE